MDNFKKDFLVKDIMNIEPECINSEATLKDTAVKMREINLGFLPICEADKLIGVVTDRDIVTRGVAEDKASNTNIKAIMTEQTIYCFDEDKIEGVVSKMAENHVRRLAVLNKDKRLVGIISLDDIAIKVGTDILKSENFTVNIPM